MDTNNAVYTDERGKSWILNPYGSHQWFSPEPGGPDLGGGRFSPAYVNVRLEPADIRERERTYGTYRRYSPYVPEQPTKDWKAPGVELPTTLELDGMRYECEHAYVVFEGSWGESPLLIAAFSEAEAATRLRVALQRTRNVDQRYVRFYRPKE